MMSRNSVRVQEMCNEALQMSAVSLTAKADEGKSSREAFEQVSRKVRQPAGIGGKRVLVGYNSRDPARRGSVPAG